MKVYCPVCGALTNDIYRNPLRNQKQKDVLASCKNGHDFIYQYIQPRNVARTMTVHFENNPPV